MRAGMVQVFPFQVNLAAVLRAQPFGEVKRGGTADVIPEQLVEFFLETVAFQHFQVLLL